MRNFTSAVPSGRLLFLDMRSECLSVAAHTDGFYNSSYVWEVMDNFGGGNGMYVRARARVLFSRSLCLFWHTAELARACSGRCVRVCSYACLRGCAGMVM
jgi:hypothetical protein